MFYNCCVLMQFTGYNAAYHKSLNTSRTLNTGHLQAGDLMFIETAWRGTYAKG